MNLYMNQHTINMFQHLSYMYSNRESIKDLSVLDSVSHLFPLKPPAAAVVEFPGVTAACGGHRPRTEGTPPSARWRIGKHRSPRVHGPVGAPEICRWG